MTTTVEATPERHEIEVLLPWHAAGRLDRRDALRVEAALEADPGLALQYALVREELAETIRLNEMLGAPSGRAMARLFARIEAEGPPVRQRSRRIAAWFSEQMSRLSPRALAWSAGAAVLAIVLQAGLIAGLWMQDSEVGKWRTVLVPGPVDAVGAAYALISFTPQATVGDITKLLEAHKVAVVDGPRAGGMYKVRVGAPGLSRDELVRIVKRLQDESRIIRFAAPTQ